MKLKKWISFIDHEEDIDDKKFEKRKKLYNDYSDLNKREQKIIRNIIVEWAVKNKSITNGSYHQNAPRGVPVVEYENKLAFVMITTRRWDDIMACALSKLHNKKYMSMDEFWKEKEREKQSKKLKWDKYKREDYYFYMDLVHLDDDLLELCDKTKVKINRREVTRRIKE